MFGTAKVDKKYEYPKKVYL